MSQKENVTLELRKILEDGYRLQQKLGAFQVRRIPHDSENAFREYLNDGASGSAVYSDFTASVHDAFEQAGLSFTRFRNKTESIDPTIEPSSPKAKFIRQLTELDKIVNDSTYFDTYKLPEEKPPVKFEGGIITQGYRQHSFNTNSDEHLQLIGILWKGREILDRKGRALKSATSTPREVIHSEINISHERFKDIVRAIKLPMKRKGISLTIKFHKDVYISVEQDRM